MPGALTHLAAGAAMFIIGRFYFKNYFEGVKNKNKESLILLFVCLFFSVIPDFFLIIYYLTYILPFEVFLIYHYLVIIVSGPLAIAIILILKYQQVNIKRKPIIMMGMWCILLHIAVDIFIANNTIFI